MKTFDTASFQLTAEQQTMLDELYPIINEEFKTDVALQNSFNLACEQPNPKLAFVSAINPLVIKMAHDLGSTLNIPLAAIISRTIANEWLEEVKTFDPAKPLEAVMDRVAAEMKAVVALPVGIVPVERESQDEYLKGIENRGQSPTIYGWSKAEPELTVADKERITAAHPAMAAPYGTEKVAEKDEPIIPTSVPRNPLARGSAGQDRSKPVLTVAVLRGLHELLKHELSPKNTVAHLMGSSQYMKGRPDSRLAVKYLQRLAAWGDKREASKEK